MNEESNIKPTFRKPVSDQAKSFDKNFNRSMNINGVNLNEVDGLLTEKEQSLKKKIFSLAKMEALVFSDPKLSTVYNEMAENGEEKYGYHYNETIQNMIFNDYVLNSPKYLQKYKQAIPKEKKRRDKSGINQLKKSGAEKMRTKTSEVEETTGAASSGAFAPAMGFSKQVDETTTSASSGAYVGPVAWGDGDLKKGTKGQAMRKPIWKGGTIIQESEYLTDPSGFEKYVNALNEEFEMNNEPSPLSGAETMGRMKHRDDELRRLSANDYSEFRQEYGVPDADWLQMSPEEKSSALNDYLGEQSDANFVLNNSDAYGKVDNMSPADQKIIKNDIQTGTMDENMSPDMYSTKEDLMHLIKITKERTGKGLSKEQIPMLAGEALYTIAVRMANRFLPISWDELPDTNSMWDYIDQNGNMSFNDLLTAVKEAANDRMAESDMGGEMDMFMNEDNDMQTITIQVNGYPYYLKRIDSTHFFMSNNPDNEGIAWHIGQFSDKPYYNDIRSWLKGGESPEGREFSDELNEKAKSKKQQRFMGMVHAVQKGELSPDEVGGSVVKAANSMSDKDAEDFASTKHKGLPEKKVDENQMLNELSLYDTVEYVSDRTGEDPFPMQGEKWQFVNAKYPDGKIDIGVYRFGQDVVYDYEKWREAMNINETESSMIEDNPMSMSNKSTPNATVSNGNVETGAMGGGINENMNLLEELNNELDAYSIHHSKLKKMAEDRKPSALVLKDRLGAENKTNFKSDMQKSDTKEVIDVEKELQWKDQQTDVGDDPQKLGQDIEKQAIKATKGEALKNVGNSTNDKGDETPKRNLTTEEEDEVNMYRLGLGDYVYDNKPDQRFEDRMKADMGDKLYQQRQKKLEFRGKAPMYNKDTQPIEDGVNKVQFDKEETGWNEREGLKETMITGRYKNILNKRKLIEFTLNEVKLIESDKAEDLFKLDFTGLGNTYLRKTEDYKVKINETVANAIDSHQFYTDGSEVFAVKNPVKSINENEEVSKPIVNEQVDKMKHLLGYNPKNFIDTNNIKNKRGF